MPIEFKKKQAIVTNVASVEEAEGLLEWLLNKPAATMNLSACTHLHPANVQVLMACKTRVTAWPTDSNLRAWLESTLKSA